MPKPRASPAPLPSKEAILEFIRESPQQVGKREIARAFAVRGADRAELKAMIRELEAEGLIARGPGRRLHPASGLPSVTVLVIAGVDADGEVLARPANWERETAPPAIYVMPERGRRPAVGAGERVLARLRRREEGAYEARIMKRLARAPARVLGHYRLAPDGGRVQPTDRRAKREYLVPKGEAGGARPGELVLVEPMAERHGARPLALKPARVVERLGHFDEPRAISLIAIHSHDIPSEFTAEALALAAAATPVGPAGRVDLRGLPLVTIDGPDARDFDDAVWAEPDADVAGAGGWHAVVAIADVGHYVRPGDPLDRVAYERGNSVYFPDRVVPMLPEALSNELCSLRPREDRACLAAHLWIGGDGGLRRHRFERGLMRSAARLTYEQVQAARDGRSDEVTAPLLDDVIGPLYGVFAALDAARRKRGALEIELPERQVTIGEDGRIARIAPRPRLNSHRLIEELMIAANVAAAETLEKLGQPCMYRVHEPPDPLKVRQAGDFLAGIGYRLARGQTVRPAQFNQVLAKARGRAEARLVNDVILRCQSQAVYSPENLGHYGLGLRRYAHFTSPIRRYADLLVHRALIGGLARRGPDEGGIGPHEDAAAAKRFTAAGEHVSMTERRAMAAEREAMDRYMAAFLEDSVGASFPARINGVTRFGLFVTLDETGADGLVPMRSLLNDRYDHDEAGHCLLGRSSGRRYTLGDSVEARLREADPVTGSLIFELLDADKGRAGRAGRRPKSDSATKSGAGLEAPGRRQPGRRRRR